MAQYDVYANPDPRSRERVPYLVDVQSAMLSELRTRFVVPLSTTAAALPHAPRRLSPTFVVQGQLLALQPHLAAGIDARQLKRPVASLADRAADIVGALDAVVSGL